MANVFVQKKQIVIMLKGDIPVLGVSGPIDNPYWETLDRISQMLMYNVPIYEVLSDGSKVQLDLVNFDQENDPNKTGLRSQYESTYKSNPTKLDTSVNVAFSAVAKEASTRMVAPKPTKAQTIKNTEYEEKVHSRIASETATITEEGTKGSKSGKANRKVEKANRLYVPPKTEEVEEK